MKLVKGTHHVALKCKDTAMFEETRKFYCDLLGIEVRREWGEGADAGFMLDTGNSILEVFASGSVSTETGSVNHYALATDDTDACVKAVRDAGYKITMEPTDMTIPCKSGENYNIRVAFCVGPCGEEIEFFCEK